MRVQARNPVEHRAAGVVERRAAGHADFLDRLEAVGDEAGAATATRSLRRPHSRSVMSVYGCSHGSRPKRD